MANRIGINRTKPYSPSGGLNNSFVATSLNDVELQEAENVVIDLDDTIRKRNGFEEYGDVASAGARINGFGEYKKVDNTWVEWIVVAGALKVRDKGTSAWSATLATFDNTAMVNGQDILFHSGAAIDTGTVTAPFYTSSITDTTKSWTANEHKNRLLVITGGTGAGLIVKIANNTANKLELFSPLAIQPDNTSTYGIYEQENILILGDGTNELVAYNGTTATTITDSPKGNILSVWQQRLIVAGIDGNENLVMMSQIGNPYEFEVDSSSYSVASPQNFTSYKGEVKGLSTITIDAERLLVYTDRSIFEIIYQNGIYVKERDFSFGCVGSRAIARVDGNPTALATDKSIRIFGNRTQVSTGMTVDDIGYRVKDTLEEAYNVLIGGTTRVSWHGASACFANGNFYLAVSLNSPVVDYAHPQLDTILVFNYLKNRWTKFSINGLKFTTIGILDNRLVLAGYGTGTLYIQKENTSLTRFEDMGNSVNAYIKTKDIVMESSSEKTFSSFRVWVGNEASIQSEISTEVYVRKADGKQDKLANYLRVEPIEQETGIDKTTSVKQFYMVKRGFTASVQFSNNQLGQDMKITKIEVGYTSADNRSSQIK